MSEIDDMVLEMFMNAEKTVDYKCACCGWFIAVPESQVSELMTHDCPRCYNREWIVDHDYDDRKDGVLVMV